MGWLEGIRRKIELAGIKKENRDFARKFGNGDNEKTVPAMFVGMVRDPKIKKEIIGTHTGKVTGYETDSGRISAGCDYHDHRTGIIIKSPETEEFEAMQALNYPHCP